MLVAIAVAAFFSYTYHANYGAGHFAAVTPAAMTNIQPSTLDVIYERNNHGVSDFLHLQVDTTYIAHGKGAFAAKSACKRTLAMRRFDGSYHPAGIRSEDIFVTDGTALAVWHDTGDTRRIMGYDCRCAEASFNGRTWQAWYTDRLPYHVEGINTTDGLEGLILEVCDLSDGSYSLKARLIAQKIG